MTSFKFKLISKPIPVTRPYLRRIALAKHVYLLYVAVGWFTLFSVYKSMVRIDNDTDGGNDTSPSRDQRHS